MILLLMYGISMYFHCLSQNFKISPKMKRREFSVFIIFSDTYTCTYVV